MMMSHMHMRRLQLTPILVWMTLSQCMFWSSGNRLTYRDIWPTCTQSLYALASPELEILAFIVSFGAYTNVFSVKISRRVHVLVPLAVLILIAELTSILRKYRYRCIIVSAGRRPIYHDLLWIVLYSNNIFKLYETLSRHFDRYPEDRNRFPNFTSRPFIARGPAGPLEGDLHSAQYFHGRQAPPSTFSAVRVFTNSRILPPSQRWIGRHHIKAPRNSLEYNSPAVTHIGEARSRTSTRAHQRPASSNSHIRRSRASHQSRLDGSRRSFDV